jgi:hypothetical protein
LKRNKLIFYLIGTIVLVLVVQIIRSSFSNPGMERFAEDFEELGFYRNENNTGPVLRIYAIRSLGNNTPEYMQEFADSQPHTKYGRTIVFFFSPDLNEKVNLSPQEPFFPEKIQPFLLAQFEKTPMGEGRFSIAKPWN